MTDVLATLFLSSTKTTAPPRLAGPMKPRTHRSPIERFESARANLSAGTLGT